MPVLNQRGYRLIWHREQTELPDLPPADDAAEFFEAVWQQLDMAQNAENARLLSGTLFGKAIRIREPSLRWWRRVQRIEREFQALVSLDHVGVPVPHPIVCGTARSKGVVSRAFLLEAALPGRENLAELLARDELAQEDRLKLFEAVGQLIRALHEHGYSHRDLSCRNVMVGHTSGEFQTSLIDCPRAERIWMPLRRNHLRRYDIFRIARSAHRLGAGRAELACMLETAQSPYVEQVLSVMDLPVTSWPVLRYLWWGG